MMSRRCYFLVSKMSREGIQSEGIQTLTVSSSAGNMGLREVVVGDLDDGARRVGKL